MDESDVERGIMTGTMLLDCRLAEIRRRAASVPAQVARECSECGDDIPQARVLAVPGVGRCVDCQRLSERKSWN